MVVRLGNLMDPVEGSPPRQMRARLCLWLQSFGSIVSGTSLHFHRVIATRGHLPFDCAHMCRCTLGSRTALPRRSCRWCRSSTKASRVLPPLPPVRCSRSLAKIVCLCCTFWIPHRCCRMCGQTDVGGICIGRFAGLSVVCPRLCFGLGGGAR